MENKVTDMEGCSKKSYRLVNKEGVYRPKYGELILGSEKSFSLAHKQTFGHEFFNFGNSSK